MTEERLKNIAKVIKKRFLCLRNRILPMKPKFIVIYFLLAALLSCKRAEIIPQEDMVKIYHDMYLLDQSLLNRRCFSHLADTLLIYRPIFEKYGYTGEDYAASVSFYLERPEKFSKLFLEVKNQFQHRLDFINDSITREMHLRTRWNLADSVRALGHDSILTTQYYRALDMLFFEKDTIFKQEYLQADSAVMASYKLSPFELYEGNPFELYPFSHKALIIVADTTATADSAKAPGSNGKTEIKGPKGLKKMELPKTHKE